MDLWLLASHWIPSATASHLCAYWACIHWPLEALWDKQTEYKPEINVACICSGFGYEGSQC